MKISVEFIGFPAVSEAIGKNKMEVDVTGRTVTDLLTELVRIYGKKMEDVLYVNGKYNQTVQIARNGILITEHDTPLQEGQTVRFMLLLAGG